MKFKTMSTPYKVTLKILAERKDSESLVYGKAIGIEKKNNHDTDLKNVDEAPNWEHDWTEIEARSALKVN